MPPFLQSSSIVTDATAQFLGYGITGALSLIFGVVIIVMWKDYKNEVRRLHDENVALQEQRVQDAKESSEQLITVVEKATAALTNVSATLEQQRETMIEVRRAIDTRLS